MYFRAERSADINVASINVQCVVGCCSVLQCAAVCCSVLQFVAVCYSVLPFILM